MNVTRDVIHDLLPAYFAGDVSDDTRALVEAFFATDPEFGRMAEQFRRLHDEHLGDERVQSPAERERKAFDHVKTRAKRRYAAVVWGIGALVACGMAIPALVDRGFQHPGLIIGAVFAAMAGLSWLSSRSSGAWASALSDGEPAGSAKRRTRRSREHA
jgi:anti-sigma factor RsiW